LYTEVSSVWQVTTKLHKQPHSEAPALHLRADAKRNRDKLLGVADAVFMERGADASMEEVAHRAKVGIGTLYRHFPTREALLVAACDDRLLALATQGDARPPLAALAGFLARLVKHAGRYGGLASSLGLALASESPGCHAVVEAGKSLLARAKTAGAVRRDVSFDDMVWMASALSLAVAQDPREAHRVDRLVALFIEGLRPRMNAARRQRAAR
jgi:AcrR family transcriptional regulator